MTAAGQAGHAAIRRRSSRVRPVVGVGRGHSQDEAESVLSIQVEAIKTLLPDETERLVQRQRSAVVVFGLEDDLARN